MLLPVINLRVPRRRLGGFFPTLANDAKLLVAAAFGGSSPSPELSIMFLPTVSTTTAGELRGELGALHLDSLRELGVRNAVAFTSEERGCKPLALPPHGIFHRYARVLRAPPRELELAF